MAKSEPPTAGLTACALACVLNPLGLCCRATMATQGMQAMQPWRMVWPTTMHWPTECTPPHWVPSHYLAKVPLLSLLLHEAGGRACLVLVPLAGLTSHCSSKVLTFSCPVCPGYPGDLPFWARG